LVTVIRGVGAVLLVIGIGAYVATGAASATALAPAVPGLILLVLGLLAGDEQRRPGMVTAALIVAGFGVLASLMPLAELPALLTGGDVERPAAVLTSAVMAVLCLVVLVMGWRSRAARPEA
jgi:hypothetical protein